MCEKRCSNCILAARGAYSQFSETVEVDFTAGGAIKRISSILFQTSNKETYDRGCLKGGRTTKGWDKCISKLEFRKRS